MINHRRFFIQDSEKSKLEEKLLLTEIRRCALNSDDEGEKESELLVHFF